MDAIHIDDDKRQVGQAVYKALSTVHTCDLKEIQRHA